MTTESEGFSPGAIPSPIEPAEPQASAGGGENPVSENHTTNTGVVHGEAAAGVPGGPEPPETPQPFPDPPLGVRLTMPSGEKDEFLRRFLFVESEYADEDNFEAAMKKFALAIRAQGLQNCLPTWNEWQVVVKAVRSLGQEPDAGQSLGAQRNAILTSVFGKDWRQSVAKAGAAAPGGPSVPKVSIMGGYG